MAVHLVKEGAEWILTLSGVVDVTEAGALHAAAREAAGGAPRAVVARLDGLAEVDTSTTQVLLALKQGLAASGRVLRLQGAPTSVEDLWRRAGLDLLF